MDRIIKITLGLFTIILILFVGIVSYNAYIDNSYRTSLVSTYTYNCTISTDSTLTNVTFYIPVPATKTGTSPIVTKFGSHDMPGVPSAWTTTLLGTGKTTVLQIETPSIVPPEGTTSKNPYVITFSATLKAKGLIDTADPVQNSPMFRPVQNLAGSSCPAGSFAGAKCFSYITPVYADYIASPNAEVRFASYLTGRNTWNIFEPKSNEYQTGVSLLMFGENHGWTTAQGYLETGIGSYDAPALSG